MPRRFQKISTLPDKRLRVFAMVLLAMGFIDGASGLITYMSGQQLLGIVFLGLAFGYAVVFLPLLLSGRYAMSRILVPYYSVTILFFAASYYGPGVNVQLSIFIGAIYPFLVFSPKERGYILATIPAPLIFYAALELTQFHALDPIFHGNFHLTAVSNLSRVSMTVASFCIVSVALYMFARQTGMYEDRLQAANKNLDLLVRTICHDIRNPLMVSIGYTKILKRSTTETIERPLNAIVKANQQIDSIINGVVELHKLNSGKFSILLESVCLSKVIEECLFTLQSKLQKKSVDVKINVTDDLFVMSNQTLLAQSVINNILTNAIKFSESGSSIYINATRQTGKQISIRIADKGVGIPESILDKIFDPYAYTTRLGTHDEKGHGFGLPIAKAYVEAMGGRISVKSKTQAEDALNHGTEFEIFLTEAV